MTDTVLARIRQLYRETTAQTIERDLREAIALLKTLPDEVARAPAAVYMDGLSQMRSEWRIEADRRRRRSAAAPRRPGPTATKKSK